MSPAVPPPSCDGRRQVCRVSLATPAIAFLATVLPCHPAQAQQGFEDHQNMMEQLGVKALRRGPNPNDQSTFNEATANPYQDFMPDVLRMKKNRTTGTARRREANHEFPDD